MDAAYISPAIDFWVKERTFPGDSEMGLTCIIPTISLEFLQFPPKGLSWIGKNCQIVSGVSKRVVDIRRLKRKSGTNSKKIRSNPSSKRASLTFTSDRDV